MDGTPIIGGQEHAPALDQLGRDRAYPLDLTRDRVFDKRTWAGPEMLFGLFKRNFGCPSLRFGYAFEVTVGKRSRLPLATSCASFARAHGPSGTVLYGWVRMGWVIHLRSPVAALEAPLVVGAWPPFAPVWRAGVGVPLHVLAWLI
jgi:hypothetical protein